MAAEPQTNSGKRGRLAVLASHGGTTLQALIDACERRELSADVVLVISNNSSSGALARATRHGINALHLSGRTHPGGEDKALAEALGATKPDWVVLAGYMKRLGASTLQAFAGRIINTHPALLPHHGGQGFFGDRVHAAVLAAGDTRSGATIHLVDGNYDQGRILAQTEVPVLRDDSIETLRERVQIAEKALLVATLARQLGG